MSYDALGLGALDYSPCRYGRSKLVFRGPERRLDVPYVTFLGGTKTYGKFIKTPFAALVESELGVNCINLGIPNAGIDALVNDGFIKDTVQNGLCTVVQVFGANNLSNRFYTVHPRRNDRFVAPSTIMSAIYSEVDFSEFHFTKHMLGHLFQVSPERYKSIVAELQAAWMARMRLLLTNTRGKAVLLWFSTEPPPYQSGLNLDPRQKSGPLYITREMLEQLRPLVSEIVEVCASSQAIHAGTHGMIHSEMEAMAAATMLGPKAHGEAAVALCPALKKLI